MDVWDYNTQIALDAIWKELVQECIDNHANTILANAYDSNTQIALDAIWKELVQECIDNHSNTGLTYDLDLVEYTSFTEPIVNI